MFLTLLAVILLTLTCRKNFEMTSTLAIWNRYIFICEAWLERLIIFINCFELLEVQCIIHVFSFIMSNYSKCWFWKFLRSSSSDTCKMDKFVPQFKFCITWNFDHETSFCFKLKVKKKLIKRWFPNKVFVKRTKLRMKIVNKKETIIQTSFL